LLKLEEKEQPITIDTDALFNEIIVSPRKGKTDYSIIASWKKALPLGFDGIVANLQQEYIREKNKVPFGAADRSKQLDTIEELFRKKLKDACAYPLGPKQIEIRDKIIDFLTHSDSKEELIQKLSPESQAILKKQKADAVKAKFDAFDEMKKEAEKILPTLSAEKQAELKATYSDEKKGKLPIGFDGKVVDSVMSDILRSGHDESAYAKKIQELQKDVLTFLGDKDNNEKLLLKFSPEKRAKLLTIKKLMQLAFPIEVIEKGYICKADVTNDLREKERCYFEEMSKKNDFAAEFASIPGLANLFELNPLDCEHLDEVQKRNRESANKSGLSFLNLLNQNK
jgi:vacuolar-type H+-ATPase subunit H